MEQHGDQNSKPTELDVYLAALAASSLKGDQAAYRTLLRTVEPLIRGKVRSLAPLSSHTDDMVQEILIAVHKALPTYDPERAFIPWLSAITKYRAIDVLRQWKRYRDHETIGENVLEWINETFASDDTNNSREIDEDLLAAIDKLPSKQAESIRMIKIKGLSVKEASSKTGWSESSIKTSAHRGYKALKKILLRQEGSDV